MAAPLFAAGAMMMIGGGIMQMQAGNRAAQAALEAARLQSGIARRNASRTSADLLDEGTETAGAIRARALASGVEFEGSPYVAAMEAINDSQSDAEEAYKMGRLESEYIMKTGRAQSRAYRDRARASLFSSVGGAFTSGLGYLQATT